MIRRTTWIVLVLFILVLAAAVFWQRRQDQQTAETTPTPAAAYLIDMNGRQVNRIQLSSSQGQRFEVEKGLDGSWMVVEPSGNKADQARIDQLISDLGALQVSTKLDTSPGLESLGLNPAKYQILVGFEDGSPATVYVGDKTPTQNGYYAYRQGDQVAVVEAFGMESILDTLNSPPIMNTPALVTPPGEIVTQQP